MSHLEQTTSVSATTPTVTAASLVKERKLANKQRRNAGRELHEERKYQLKQQKALEYYRRFDPGADRDEYDGQRQEKRRDNGTRAFAGRNLYNHRMAGAFATDIFLTAEDIDHHQHHLLQEEEAQGLEEEPRMTEEQATSGAMLLAMARPAKTRRHRCQPLMTDGEAFEVVEIDGLLVALDEDGWEILPDEDAEDSLLYSDIVRGTAR